jgi:hypothetical protein
MPEPAQFKESPPVEVAEVLMLFSVGRMFLGLGMAVFGWIFAQAPATMPATVIPWQDVWQAAAAGQDPYGRVIVSGRAEATPGAVTLRSPVSGQPVLAYKATVTYVRGVLVSQGRTRVRQSQVLSHHLDAQRDAPFVVKGPQADIVVAGQVPLWHLPTPAAVRHDRQPEAPAWARAMPGFRDIGAPVQDAAFETEEVTLRPGDQVTLIGVLRDAEGRQELVAPKGKELLGYMRGRAAIESKLAFAGEGARNGRNAALAALVIGLLLLVPWELPGWIRRYRKTRSG